MTQSKKLALALTALSLSTTGCNLFGRLDQPSTPKSVYDAALAAANAGDCNTAITMLQSITRPNDNVLAALGWAQLCVGGATASVVASSIYQFGTTNPDYTKLGVLARNLMPMTSGKFTQIQNANTSFGRITDGTRRNADQAVANFSLAAAILATEALNDGSSTLNQTDIAPAACASDANSCSSTANCTTGMVAADVTAFVSAISGASANLTATGSSDLGTLANNLTSGLSGGTNSSRCFIFNFVIPNP